MSHSTFEPPRPLNLTDEDKFRADYLWREHLRHFCNDLANVSDLVDLRKGDPTDDIDRLDKNIRFTVTRAFDNGEYGDPKSPNPTLLTPQVNRTVEEILDRYVNAPDLMAPFLGQNNARGTARREYMRGYLAEYKRLWLSRHQQMANEELREYIRGPLEDMG